MGQDNKWGMVSQPASTPRNKTLTTSIKCHLYQGKREGVVHFHGYSSFVTYKLFIFHSTVRIQFFSINPFLLSWRPNYKNLSQILLWRGACVPWTLKIILLPAVAVINKPSFIPDPASFYLHSWTGQFAFLGLRVLNYKI